MPDELRLSIEKLVYGGDGLGHANGNTVFVPFVLPGEKVRASVRVKKKQVVWANLLEITSPAAERTQPRCAHYGVCGGCHYQHISYAKQLRVKKEILRETLQRLGGVQWAGEIVEHAAAPYGYRNRAQWAVRSGMPRALGYYLAESSTIVPVDDCSVLSPTLASTFRTLQDMARSGTTPPEMKEIEVFADATDAHVALNIAFSHFGKPASQLSKLFQDALPHLESLLLLDQRNNRFELAGPGYLTQQAGGFRYRVSHLSFFQVNRFLIEDLLKAVVGGKEGKLVLDLYAGVGFFSLPLARAFRRVITVDANLAATRDLRTSAEDAGLPVTSHNVQVEDFLNKSSDKPDFVVLDPPRTGLGASAAAKLAELAAPEIAYLSCDPATLARDLSVLTQSAKCPSGAKPGGTRYEIAEVHFFDLFPQTYHIETFVRLRIAS